MSEPASGPTERVPQPASLLHEPPHPGYDPGYQATVPTHLGYDSGHIYEPGSSAPPSTWGFPAPPPAWSAAPAPSALAPVVYQGPLSVADRNWASIAHLAGFAGAMIAMPFLGPLVVLLTGGNRSAYARQHAVEALNFNLSALLWLLVSGVLVLLLIGIPMLIGLVVLYIVCSVRGALAASRGEEYRYPITLRFVS